MALKGSSTSSPQVANASSHSLSIGVIAGIAAAGSVSLLVLLSLCLWLLCRRRRHRYSSSESDGAERSSEIYDLKALIEEKRLVVPEQYIDPKSLVSSSPDDGTKTVGSESFLQSRSLSHASSASVDLSKQQPTLLSNQKPPILVGNAVPFRPPGAVSVDNLGLSNKFSEPIRLEIPPVAASEASLDHSSPTSLLNADFGEVISFERGVQTAVLAKPRLVQNRPSWHQKHPESQAQILQRSQSLRESANISPALIPAIAWANQGPSSQNRLSELIEEQMKVKARLERLREISQLEDQARRLQTEIVKLGDMDD
jgi:hypothetical protein